MNAIPNAWQRIKEIVRAGLNGQLILHCKEGKVLKLERREFERVDDDDAKV